MPTTRERLARAAIRLFVRKGLAATTTKEIAAAARIAEGTIYRYFPTKEGMAADLFNENYMALVGELREAARGARTPLDRLGAMIARFYRMFDEDRDLFAFLFIASPGQPTLPSSMMTPLRLLRENSPRSEEPPHRARSTGADHAARARRCAPPCRGGPDGSDCRAARWASACGHRCGPATAQGLTPTPTGA